MKKIGRYEIIEELGRGGMGVVYKGRDPRLNRQVAIKVMLPDPDANADAIKNSIGRFLLEAEAVARLQHANIVEIHDLDVVDENSPFIVMEYVDGSSLDKLIDSNLPDTKTLMRRLEIFYQILKAMQYAHEQGVVHRDLKPGNIMVCGEDQVKIMDFGLAVLDGAHRLTNKGSGCGTPSYCAPEQITDFKNTDERTDIYSLGVILFEMVTGHVPFEVENGDLADMFKRLLSEPPPSPKSYNPRLPSSLEKVILRCLQKSKDDRFQNLGELRASFKACFASDSSDQDRCASIRAAGGQVFNLAKDRSVVLGRSSDTDINLKEVDPEHFISRRHGRITHNNGHYFYEDMKSSNGSYLNGTKLAPNKQVELHKDDRLRLGHTDFIFKT